MTIARPTVASAAATAMTRSAITDPPTPSFSLNEPNATIVRLTALSISSIDISMLIAFRREEAEHPDREQQAGQGDESERRDDDRGDDRAADHPDHDRSSGEAGRSRLARKTPPMTAARSRTPTISKGSTQSVKIVVARSLVFVCPRSPLPPQVVEMIVRTRTTTRISAATAAGTACVWKTSRVGAAFVWVSMIANRTRTLIAPM